MEDEKETKKKSQKEREFKPYLDNLTMNDNMTFDYTYDSVGLNELYQSKSRRYQSNF